VSNPYVAIPVYASALGVLAALYFLGRAGFHRLIDWWDARRNPITEEESAPVQPRYPPFGEEADEVLEGHVMVSDALGDWAPTEHELEPHLIADALLHERPWLTLHCPPSWSAWTGAHPVVRLADLERFGAMA